MSGQSDPNQSKNDYAILWILATIFIISGLLWYFFSEQLKLAFLYLRKGESMLVQIFSEKLNPLISKLDADIAYQNTENLNVFQMVEISELVGSYLMWPSIGILALMGLFMLKNHSNMRWNTKHNMDTLIRQEQKNWPQIAPVVPLDLVTMDINKGPWAMAKNPMQFAKAYKLLEVEKVGDVKAAWKVADNYKATLIKEKAYRVLVGQMGPMWQGIDKLPPYTKAIFSIFCARCEHKADEALDYFRELAQNAAKGDMQYARTDEFLKKYSNNKAVKRCTERHAYVYTVMASMLELARTDGVLASADFLWLKPVDRKLWLMLCTVGRQTAPPEVAGPWAHWLAEKEMHRSLSVPMVDEGIVALEKALAMMIYAPDEDEEDFPNETPEQV